MKIFIEKMPILPEHMAASKNPQIRLAKRAEFKQENTKTHIFTVKKHKNKEIEYFFLLLPNSSANSKSVFLSIN
ncbi:MAG: hypothetical protein J5817_05880 [Treponema sp.]|nr:hypothetical protein [Treponema sp.]